MGWNDGVVRPVSLDGLGQRYRRYRLEEAWVVQGLVRDDGMTQVEAAHLLGRHKSWVCRRLALLEKLSVAVKEDLRLGLVGPSLARQLTRLIAQYQRDDVCAAFERAVRFGAFSLAAVRRILAATAKPKQWPDELANLHDMLPPSLREDPISPRPASDYQQLLLPEEPSHETPSQEKKSDDEADPDRPKPA